MRNVIASIFFTVTAIRMTSLIIGLSVSLQHSNNISNITENNITENITNIIENNITENIIDTNEVDVIDTIKEQYDIMLKGTLKTSISGNHTEYIETFLDNFNLTGNYEINATEVRIVIDAKPQEFVTSFETLILPSFKEKHENTEVSYKILGSKFVSLNPVLIYTVKYISNYNVSIDLNTFQSLLPLTLRNDITNITALDSDSIEIQYTNLTLDTFKSYYKVFRDLEYNSAKPTIVNVNIIGDEDSDEIILQSPNYNKMMFMDYGYVPEVWTGNYWGSRPQERFIADNENACLSRCESMNSLWFSRRCEYLAYIEETRDCMLFKQYVGGNRYDRKMIRLPTQAKFFIKGVTIPRGKNGGVRINRGDTKINNHVVRAYNGGQWTFQVCRSGIYLGKPDRDWWQFWRSNDHWMCGLQWDTDRNLGGYVELGSRPPKIWT